MRHELQPEVKAERLNDECHSGEIVIRVLSSVCGLKRSAIDAETALLDHRFIGVQRNLDGGE
jgi:hypothetical protein